MRDLDIALFQFLAAGVHPSHLAISVGMFVARDGAGLAALALVWGAWRVPSSRLYLLGVAVACSLTALLSHSLASAIGLQRPFVMGLSPEWVAHPPSAALPSTHAAVMATAAFLCLARPALRGWGRLVLALTLATAWARVYTGLHFPSDIAAGFVLATGVAGLFHTVSLALRGHVPPVPWQSEVALSAAVHERVPLAEDLHPPVAEIRRPTRSQRSISCVVPCFNEGRHLDALLTQALTVLDDSGLAWEIVIVDDGSRDDTAEIARRWCREPGFRLVSLSRNFGKEAAMTAGLRAAHGDAVVLIDGDLQHPPELVARMIAHWRSGADMVYAVRSDRADSGPLRLWASRLFYRVVNASNRFELPRDAGDFRLMDRAVVDALLALPERTRLMKGLYAWVGFHSVAVPYQPRPRASGESHFHPLRLIALALDGVTAFTTWPLRAVSVVGAVLAMLAFAYGGFLVLDHLLVGNPVSGWTTIVVSLMFFAGIQLLSTGILGEYIGRIFDEVKGRPLYVVREAVGTGLREGRE